MRVIELRDIVRRDSLILYRKQYSASATLEHVSTQTVPITFVVEHSAVGGHDVSVDIDGSLDYPLIPATRALREHILQLERQGKLP
jgi:hypothetical protein